MLRLAALVAALALSFVAYAQSGKAYRIGMLEATSASANRANLDAFLRGLREAGYVEGKNIVIDYRSADGRPERFPELAADLVRAKPDIIVTRGTAAALAAKAAGPIPIVMTTSADPVGARVVPNLARPGGNVTGLSTMVGELSAKRVEIVKELVPPGSRIATLLDLGNLTTQTERKQTERTAGALGLQTTVFDVRDAAALDRALESAVQQGISALLINAGAVLLANQRTIVEFAARHKLPGVYTSRQYVAIGGPKAYGRGL